MRVLIFTSRDIFGAGGEASLMLAKEAVLREQGCTIAYVTCRWSRPKRTGELDILHSFPTWRWLLDPVRCYHEMKKLITRWKPNVLVISGHWLKFHPWIIGRLKKQIPIVVSLDLQGALEEFTEYNLIKGNNFLSHLFFHLIGWHEKRLLRHLDLVEVVSENFEEYVRRKYPSYGGQIAVVPCGIPVAFDDESHARYRSEWRRRLEIDADEVTAVYAGGLSRWQRVEDVIAFARKHPSVSVFLLTNGDVRSLGQELPNNLRAFFLPRDEVLEALCAFDYGFLLRNEDVTNHVAFPNKASEYLNARLKIIIDSWNMGCIWTQFAEAFVSLKSIDLLASPPEKRGYKIEVLQYKHTVPALFQAYRTAWNAYATPDRMKKQTAAENGLM